MKKILSLILIFILLFSAAGCGGDQTPSVTDTTVYLNGVALEDYYIVVPDKNDAFGNYAANILLNYINDILGIKITMITERTAEKDYEILIGNTSRDESKEALELEIGNDEYFVYTKNNKVIVYGSDFYIGGGVGALINEYINVGDKNNKLPDSPTPKKVEFKDPDSVILMISDGCGPNHIEAAKGQTIEEYIPEKFPNITLVNTNNFQGKTTDSAASATAMSTGVKTTNRFLGKDHTGKNLKNMTELVHSKGGKVALLTNDGITGATPSAFAVHVDDRGNTDAINMQYDSLKSTGKLQYAEGSLGDNLRKRSEQVICDISLDGGIFFTMIEETNTDSGGHSNNIETVKSAVERFNDVVAFTSVYVTAFPRIALIVTSDHETGGIKLENGEFVFTTTNHTSTPVKVFALGKGTEALTSKELIENTEIAHFIAAIYGETNFNK